MSKLLMTPIHFVKIFSFVNKKALKLENILSSLYFLTAVSAKYNCNNEGPNGCLHAGKCTYFGTCECTPGFHGYDCGLQLGKMNKMLQFIA